MRGRQRGYRLIATMMLMAVITVIPVYAEPESDMGDFIEITDSIKDYDGIVTDEMIEAWEQENNPGNPIQNPTDPYGNRVEWDMQGSGNEEGAGSEMKEDRMEAPTYDAKEQEEILESLHEKDEVPEKGWLCAKGDLGDNWPGYNVTVALYDRNHKRMEMTLYSQNGFEVKREVPIGSYKIYRAYVPGDENGSKYPLVVSDSSIEVEQGRTTELTLWRAVETSAMKENGAQESRTEPVSTISQDSADVMTAAWIVMGVLIFLLFGAVIYWRKVNLHRYQ